MYSSHIHLLTSLSLRVAMSTACSDKNNNNNNNNYNHNNTMFTKHRSGAAVPPVVCPLRGCAVSPFRSTSCGRWRVLPRRTPAC